MYVHGFLPNVVKNDIGWICVCMFTSLVTHVFFCCYRCWLDVLSLLCNYSSCVGVLYLVWTCYDDCDHPCQLLYHGVHSLPSSHWTTTVDPVGIDTKIFEVSLFWSFLPCLCIRFLWCSSSLSILIGFLSITGIMLHTGWLNSNVAGLGRPCPSGVVLICSNAMCVSPPESEHFLYCA